MNETQMRRYMSKIGPRYTVGTRNIDVLEVFGEYDDQLWFDIPGFPAYQLSNKGYVRSFKKKYKHPYGTILTPRNTKSNGIVFELTDKNNISRRIGLSEIERIADRSEAYYTNEVNMYDPNQSARNKRAFINFNNKSLDEIPGKIVRKPKPIRKEDCEIYHFSVIPDPVEDKTIIKPIRFEGE